MTPQVVVAFAAALAGVFLSQPFRWAGRRVIRGTALGRHHDQRQVTKLARKLIEKYGLNPRGLTAELNSSTGQSSGFTATYSSINEAWTVTVKHGRWPLWATEISNRSARLRLCRSATPEEKVEIVSAAILNRVLPMAAG
ncbi:MAG TPA: hypothetical protein VMT30_05580 [Candidatus Saccharimonadia bacterium]|nr:hypothetical protein [Candidatus Saccharimonadia bacterium]